jgi:hypothetical protein
MPSVRVATYNVYLGADLSALFAVTGPDELADQVKVIRSQPDATHAGERARAIAGLLAPERPDLVGLQEVARWTVAPLDEDGVAGPEQTFVDFRHELLGALAAAGCAYDACAVNENFAGALPVSERELFGVVGANVTHVRRDSPVQVVAERTGAFAAGHHVATGIEGIGFPIVRSWGAVDVRVDGVPVRFLNTHTEAYDPAVRDAQCKELLDLQCEVDAPVILVGDLNARPEAVGVSDPWADAWTQGRGTGFTCGQSADLANVHSALAERIDYVWVRGARVLRCAVVGDRPADRTDPHRLWPSDHAGVVADLHLADSR